MIASLFDFARNHYNALVVLAGVSVLGASAGMIGAFAVLRKRALTGDALSHAALPGLCLAFLILRERHMAAMLLGALASGVAGVMILSALVRWTRIREDAAIGTVLSVFFGLGIVLSRVIQNMEAVGSKAGLDSYIFGKTTGMTRGDDLMILVAALFSLAAVVLFYKEFLSISFDADFARSLGWPVYRLDLLLMSLVALAVVIGLPTVGVVLISALLIMPGAAARFWTDRLSTLLWLAGLIGLGTGFIGTLISATVESVNLPAGPVIVLTGTGFFLLSLLFGRKRGLIARIVDQRQFQRQWKQRQLLRAAYESVEATAGRRGPVTTSSLLARKSWSTAEVGRLLVLAQNDGLLQPVEGEQWELTPAGYEQAVKATRGQRLWEAFLVQYPEQAGSTVNLASDSVAEFVPPSVVAELTDRLQAAGRWPHSETAA